MQQDQKDQQLDKKFPQKNVIRFNPEKRGEKISPVFEVPKTEPTKPEAESQKEQVEKPKIEFPKTEKQKVKELTKVSSTSSPTSVSDAEQQEVKKVENILEEGLRDIYQKMDPDTQHQFKAQGEDTAKAVHLLLQKTKVKIKEIVNLIIKWLKLIPTVNKFFVEQEAKIKADKLMAAKRQRDEEGD